MNRGILGALGLFGALAVGCATAQREELPLAKGASGRRALVVVVDTSQESASVRAPAQAALEAALVLTSGDPAARSSVGVITEHDGEASVLATLEDDDDAAREALARKVAGVERAGLPSVARGVRRALDMLSAAQADRGSLVLVLAPSIEEHELDALESELSLRGIKLHVSALGRGSHDAVTDVAANAFGFAVARSVPPVISGGQLGGGRLAWLAPGGVTLPPVAGARAIKGALSDARVWDRLPEKLNLSSAADDSRAVLVYRPTWELGFDEDAPSPIVFVGEPVPISLVLRSRTLPAASALEVSLQQASGTQLLKGAPGPGGLRYDGVVPAPEKEGPEEARLAVDFKLGAASFSQPVSARYVARVRTGQRPPRVTLTPDRLDLGVAWVGTRLAAQVVVRGDPERPTHVEVESVPGASTPAPLELAPGEEKTLELAFEPGRLAPGTRLKINAQVTATDGPNARPRVRGDYTRREKARPISGAPSWTGVVPVIFEAREATLADALPLGNVEPGNQVTLERSFKVTPRAVVEVTGHWSDAQGVALETRLEGDKLTITARADASAPAGKRTGVVEVRLAGSRGAPLTRPVSVEVVPRPVLALEVAPAEVNLTGRYGWAETRITLGANEHASLALTPGTLEGQGARITPRRDIRITPADASWDRKTLEPGQAREVLVRVYLGSDLPAGRYVGEVSLRLEGEAGREPVVRALPIAVEVTR